jgi:hypothetical protein
MARRKAKILDVQKAEHSLYPAFSGGGREGADSIYSCLQGDSTTVGVLFVLGVMNDSIV